MPPKTSLSNCAVLSPLSLQSNDFLLAEISRPITDLEIVEFLDFSDAAWIDSSVSQYEQR